MSQGYIKLSRSLENWRYFKKSNYLSLWIYMLLEANHQSEKWEDIVIERGQFVTSIDRLSRETGISVQTVRTILSKFKDEEISVKSTNKYTLITILKYDEYQGSMGESNKQSTNKQQSANKQLTTNNNDKNNKNDKKYIYKGSDELVRALEDFEEMRKKIKKPLTDRARDMLVRKLESYTQNENEQIEILEQSIVNCWQNVYPLKKEDRIPTYDNSYNRNMTDEDETELLKMMGKA